MKVRLEVEADEVGSWYKIVQFTELPAVGDHIYGNGELIGKVENVGFDVTGNTATRLIKVELYKLVAYIDDEEKRQETQKLTNMLTQNKWTKNK